MQPENLLKLTSDVIDARHEKLSHLKFKLCYVDRFSNLYVLLYKKGILPKPLTLMYRDKKFTSFTQLLKEYEKVYRNTVMTAEQMKMMEEKTRDQASSKLRAGCVTASRLRSVYCMLWFQIHQGHYLLPSVIQSWLVSIPRHNVCMRVRRVRLILEVMSKQHESFSVPQSGLILDELRPFILE